MILAFGCQARVGKSTIVSHLIEKYGGVELSFASPLYDILYYAQEKCEFPKEKDRTFLQWIGTEWAREKDPNIWISILEKKIESLPKGTNIYISDLRFSNEYEWCKKKGITTIRIIRNEKIRDPCDGNKNHISENSLINLPLEDWDYVCYNNSNNLEIFFQNIDSYIKTNIEKPNNVSEYKLPL